MKIIRWLLSHTFLILLIVTVIYGYMFWGNLAGENTPAGKALASLSNEFVEVEEFIAAVKAKQAQLSGEKSLVPVAKSEQKTKVSHSNERTPVNTNYSYKQPPAVAKNSAIIVEAEVEQPKNNKPVHVIEDVKQAEYVASTNAQAKTMLSNKIPAIAKTNAKTNTAGKFISAEVAQQLDNVDKHGKVINDTSQQYSAIKSLWITARKSFYQRNYQLSEQSYQQVIDKTKDNFDAYGELGNVYFNQGKNKQAASAYFEAAAILVRNGQVNRAKSLMGLLRHLDESKADELKQLIDSPLS